jgi:DNA-binding phage protein
MSRCAEKAHLAREAIYRMLSEEGNPEFRSVEAILEANGLKFSIRPKTEEATAA